MFEAFEDAEERSHLRGINGEDGATILDDDTVSQLIESQLVVVDDHLGNQRIGYTQEADAIRKMAPAVKALQQLGGKPGSLVRLRPGSARHPQKLVIDSPMREIYVATAVYLNARQSLTRHRLSPYLQALADVADELYIDYLPSLTAMEMLSPSYAVELENTLLKMEQRLRAQLRTGVLASRAANVRRKENKNYASGKRLFEACSKCSSKILSVRMDLLFHPDAVMRITPRTNEDRLSQAKQLRNLILQHRKAVKKKFKRGLIGWIYKVEFGETAGFHIHCWYLFNRHMYRIQRRVCEVIEGRWMAVTMRQGYGRRVKGTDHFNCAVGLLDLSSAKVQAGIHKILWYLTKGDELIALELADGSKTFLRSRLPVPKKKGRPRQRVVPDYGYTNRRGQVLPGFNPWTSISALKRYGPTSNRRRQGRQTGPARVRDGHVTE